MDLFSEPGRRLFYSEAHFGKWSEGADREGPVNMDYDHQITSVSRSYPEKLLAAVSPSLLGDAGRGLRPFFPEADAMGALHLRVINDWVLAVRFRLRPEAGEGGLGRRYWQIVGLAMPFEAWREAAPAAILTLAGVRPLPDIRPPGGRRIAGRERRIERALLEDAGLVAAVERRFPDRTELNWLVRAIHAAFGEGDGEQAAIVDDEAFAPADMTAPYAFDDKFLAAMAVCVASDPGLLTEDFSFCTGFRRAPFECLVSYQPAPRAAD